MPRERNLVEGKYRGPGFLPEKEAGKHRSLCKEKWSEWRQKLVKKKQAFISKFYG